MKTKFKGEIMQKKDENEMEQRLLSHTSIDELIKMKMEEELKAEFEKQKETPKKEIVTDISKVPTDLIFSKIAVFKVFNRINKIETFVAQTTDGIYATDL